MIVTFEKLDTRSAGVRADRIHVDYSKPDSHEPAEDNPALLESIMTLLREQAQSKAPEPAAEPASR